MKFTYNWLNDFAEIKIAPQALAEKLTMAGLEVTSLEEREGDFVFEIEVTSNRPDCLSVIGIAREVAAITNSKLKPLCAMRHAPCVKSAKRKTRNAERIVIKIENKKDCPLYTAKIIKGIKVGPSPDWLKTRLELVGCRSVNNIVDVTNYVLFELGEPLHAFDLDKLSQNTIFVRRAKADEKITAIDGGQKILNADILVIADEKKPVAIAGIVGGKDTEVTEGTTNVLLEAAVFNPIIVRRGRQAIGLSSESAYRFERGIDLEVVEKASLRAAQLLEDLAGGGSVLAKASGSTNAKKKAINLNASRANKILGINIAPAKIKKTLNSLGFKAKVKPKNNFMVLIPSHRADVSLEIDLIEEIARVFGYNNIPASLPAVKPQLTLNDTRPLVSRIKNILVGLGLNEVVTYSLIDKDLLEAFGKQERPGIIEILNPLSKEQEILRPSLIPSLSACVAYNLNQKQGCINIFEVAKVFLDSKNMPQEELRLAIALSGAKSLLLEQGAIKDEATLLHLKGILEVLFDRLGIKDYSLNSEGADFRASIYAHKEKIGLMMKLPKDILDKLNIKNKDVFCLELALSKALSYVRLKKSFTPPAKYPGIARDISFILKDDISIKDMLDAMKEKGGFLLEEIKIIDYYKGKQIPPGFRGLTISCLYRSKERTLTETEINPLHSLVSEILTGRFGAKIR
jgi:phenylalanyl-tRNA synthetase beta chain